MRTKIVKLGNSQGIRIPKAVLEQTGLRDEVEILVRTDSIVIRPIAQPRAGWDDAFAEMASRGDDRLLDGEQHPSHSFDDEEWEWT